MTAQPDFSLIVGYGTDMGNAEDAAMSFCEALEEATGIKSEAVELNQVDIANLQSASHLVVVVSTFGDGEFPDNALLFWEALSAEGAERLAHLQFAVLALGDSSYEFFCNAGLLLDKRLEELGASRLTERTDVDGPYLQPSKEWTTDLVKLLAAGPNWVHGIRRRHRNGNTRQTRTPRNRRGTPCCQPIAHHGGIRQGGASL